MPVLDVEKLEKLIVSRGWSQAQLAEQVGCAKQHIERIIKQGRASAKSLKEIADALDASVEELRLPDVNIDLGKLNEAVVKADWRRSDVVENAKLKRGQIERLYRVGELEYEAHERLVTALNIELAKHNYEQLETLELPFSQGEDGLVIETSVHFTLKVNGREMDTVLPEFLERLTSTIHEVVGNNDVKIVGMKGGSLEITLEMRQEDASKLTTAIRTGKLIKLGVVDGREGKEYPYLKGLTREEVQLVLGLANALEKAKSKAVYNPGDVFALPELNVVRLLVESEVDKIGADEAKRLLKARVFEELAREKTQDESDIFSKERRERHVQALINRILGRV